MGFASGVVVIAAAACSQYASTNAPAPSDAGPQEAGADAVSDAAADAAPPSRTFACPPPAGACTFGREACCYDMDGSAWTGTCVPSGTACTTKYTALCDSPDPCRELYDASTARCCDVQSFSACARNGCAAGSEMCRATIMPPECSDAAAACVAAAVVFGLCE